MMFDIKSNRTVQEDFTHITEVLCTISEKYFYAGQLQDAVQVVKHGEQLVGNHKDASDADLVRLLIQQGRMLNWRSLMGDNHLKEAESILSRAREVAARLGDVGLEAYAKLHLGNNFDFRKLLLGAGEWDEALELLEEAHEVFLQTDTIDGRSTAVFFIGLVHQRLQQKVKAVAHFEQALRLAIKKGDKFEESEAVRHLGFFAFMDGKFDEAYDCAQTSLRLREAIDCRVALSSAYHAVGMIQEAQGAESVALISYQRAVEIAQNLNLQVPLVQGLLALSSLQAKNGQKEHATQLARQAYEAAQETGYPSFMNAAASKLQQLL